MLSELVRWLARAMAAGTVIASSIAQGQAAGPAALQVDNLTTPLGIDDPTPSFSWQLHDSARGAKQTAYEVLVGSSEEALGSGKGDVWDSGRVESPQSIDVKYAGAALTPSTRYYWQVKVWGASGDAYPASAISWWETALLKPENWHAQWIAYETPEEDAVRHANAAWIVNPDARSGPAKRMREEVFAYRDTITLSRPVRSAALLAAAQDTVSAWINGVSVLTADPLPPWKQMPWKKYVRAEVKGHLVSGANTIAIEAIHYNANPNGMASGDPPPMSATLFVEYDDGTTATFASGTDWKTAAHPASGWQKSAFDDSGWKSATVFKQTENVTAEPLGHPWIPDAIKALRHTFDVASPVKSARLYATSFGTYEVFLNGKRVSDDVMAPGWTDYRERLKYQIYDVTGLLNGGPNAIGALLAPGWYATPLEWFQQPNNYGDHPPAFRAQLRIEHNDGSVEWVATDTSWQANTSYILHSELYDGETQDARLAQAGWDAPGFAAIGWKPVTTVQPRSILIDAQDYPSIRVERTLDAKSVTEPKPGVYVFDFGQNMSALPRLRVQGPAGTDVRLRFAEILNPDGTLYTDNLRTAKATDHFILAGHGVEEFTAEFTFHGFRYAEITGLPSKPEASALSALVIHTDAPFAVELKTGNEMVNHLLQNILWGQRSNFVGLPTDCPQRDERLGWMADAQVFWRTATYNMDLAAFSRKFSGDMRGTQAGTPIFGIFAPGTVSSVSGSGAGWSDAGVVIPWTSWLQTGDTSIIEHNWDAMAKYLAAIDSANPNGLWVNEGGTHFGDWLSPEGQTDYTLIATAYWAYDLHLMQQMARAIGRDADADAYARQFEKVRDAFRAKFVHSDGFVAGGDNSGSPFGEINNPEAKSKGGDTQTGYVLALHMNLVPEELRAAAAKHLVAKIEANHGLLGTGFLGTPYLLEELTKTGHADLAYKLLLNTDYPSWGYLIQHGATTTWERWNGDKMMKDPSMNSYNHYGYGAVGDWIYRYAAGIDATPLDAGFHTVVLHPVFDKRLGSVDFSYPSSYGVISSAWTTDGATATWKLTLPANTSGWLSSSAASHYRLEGSPLDQSSMVHSATRNGESGYELPAGTYSFTVDLTRE